MSNVLSEQEGKLILQPYFDIFNQTLYAALSELHKGLDAMQEPLNSKEKCNVFYSQFRSMIKRHFQDEHKVRITERYGSVRLMFEYKTLARLKKIRNPAAKPANVKTKRNDGFLFNRLYSLFDNKPITCVDLVYVPNSTWSDFDYIAIQCRINDNTVWKLENWANKADLFMPGTNTQVEPKIIQPEKVIKIKGQ